MTFGDSWYLVPCRLPDGVIARGGGVKVRDTFGVVQPIRSCAELDGPGRVWRFFELTGDDSADAADLDQRRCPWLLLPPALAGVTQSSPVEEVAFLHDELANLGWAAELRIETAAGRTIDRAARARAAMPASPPPAEGAWDYELATQVPEHQIPLVPVRKDDALYLQRGRLASAVHNGHVVSRGALGQVLEPDSALLIFDDEIPATGACVTRSWQMARSPGLRFDELST
jgi:hypothetical protein